MKLRKTINSFNGGEISRRMEGRSDLDGIYDRAVAMMLNYVPTLEGPAMKRPGTQYVRPAATSASWLSRFVFNTTQSYAIEWGDLAVRFFTNGGRIEAGGEPYEVAVPYTAAEAPRISQKQSYDRLYLAHPDHPPAMLTRLSAEEFGYSEIPLKNGPFKDWNTDRSITIAWAGSGDVGAAATITAGAAIFEAGHVGAHFIFEVEGFSDVKAWEPSVKTIATDASSYIQVGAKVRSDGKVYEAVEVGGDYTGSIEPTHTQGEEWDGSLSTPVGQTDGSRGGVKWRYCYDRFGIGKITAVASATQATVEVTRALPTLATATHKWAHACFSDAEGWPHLVDVWGQRLIFWKGVEIAGSVTGDYFNFAPLDENGVYAPDMAFRRKADVADPPVWTHADKEYLLAGSTSGELVVGQINRAAGISADNLRADPQSSYGSAAAWPVAIGTALLFIQRGGRKIREAAFSVAEERFVGANTNIYARHITRSGVKWLAFQQEPEELLWCGRNDGTLVAHPHNPEQQVKGFARMQLAGDAAVLSGVSIPSTDGERDDLWILAELDGTKSVLRLTDWWDEDSGLERADAFFVDFGVSYSGEPKGQFTSGVSHLEGRQVRVLADGVEYNNLTVTGGTLTLKKPASKVTVGLGYQARLKLLRPEIRGAGATLQGLRHRIARALVRLIDSASPLFVDARGQTDRFFDRPNTLPMDSAEPLFNGDTDDKAVGGGSDTAAAGEILSDDALPSIISLLAATYDVEEFKS